MPPNRVVEFWAHFRAFSASHPQVVDDLETVRFNDWPWRELLFTKEGGIRGAGVLLLNPEKYRTSEWRIDDKEVIEDLRFVLFELTEVK